MSCQTHLVRGRQKDKSALPSLPDNSLALVAPKRGTDLSSGSIWWLGEPTFLYGFPIVALPVFSDYPICFGTDGLYIFCDAYLLKIYTHMTHASRISFELSCA